MGVWRAIAAALALLAAAPAHAAAPPLPDLTFEPDCRRAIAKPGDDFQIALRRGVRLAYASPVTVSGWRSPGAACRRFSAGARVAVSRFRWQNRDLLRESLRRLEYEAQLSYVWAYDRRYVLQRVEPGAIVAGTLDALPALQFFLDLRLATHWHVRFDHRVNLAQLAGAPDVRAKMDYSF